MTALFYVKKTVTRITDRRVGLFGYWNNIGAPVVSYYTEPVLEEMLRAGEPATVVERHVERWEPPRLVRPLVGKASVTLIARKASAPATAAARLQACETDAEPSDRAGRSCAFPCAAKYLISST